MDEDNNVSISLILSKAHVTPSKPVTVPRLELTAALLSVRTSVFLRRELKMSDITEFFWTDSRVVLGYVSNDAKRFHIFVANRVREIRDSTSPTQWNFVESGENPADIASRGMQADALVSCERWWKGPDFLSIVAQTPAKELEGETSELLDPEDTEIKKPKGATDIVTSTTNVTQTKTPQADFTSLPKRLERFSKWHDAKKAVANCLKYTRILRQRHISGERNTSSYRVIQ